MNRLQRIFWYAALLAVAMFSGCLIPRVSSPAGGSPEAWNAISNGAPIRVAVYVGPGARGVGMFRWMQLMDQCEDVVATFVDGKAIRKGALRRADLVVMPGGKSNLEEQDLGAEGQVELRRFISEGGSYVGSCAGAFLVLNSKPGKTLGMVPFRHRSGSWGGEARLYTRYTSEAEAKSGIKAGAHYVRFNGGPVMDPGDAVEGATDFFVAARFNANLHTSSSKPDLPSMGGGASCVAGRFGQGRIWVFADHPEYFPATWDLVAGAFKYLTGRKITLTVPQRKPGQLSVGYFCAPSPGPKAAVSVMRMVRDDSFDVTPLSSIDLERTDLRHVDALVISDNVETNRVKNLFTSDKMADYYRRYMDRGGKIVVWGDPAQHLPPHGNLVAVKDGSAAIKYLHRLQAAPAPEPRAPAPAKKPDAVKVGIYSETGASGCAFVRWIKMLSLSPDCEVELIDGADVRAGVLDRLQLYIAPGGSGSSQAKGLQQDGRERLKNFLRNGGGYFGTCAGCYLSFMRGDSKYDWLEISPYVAQKSPYRGGATLDIKFTEDAGLFGFKPDEIWTVRYHGGPVPLPVENPPPDMKFKPIALFNCDGVYEYNTNTVPVMAGYPALFAGTYGSGKVVGCSPHPESYSNTQPIIRGGLKYLTGRDCNSEYPQRTRGNRSVALLSSHLHKDGANLAMRLYTVPTIDLRAVSSETIGEGELEHADVLLVAHPSKNDFGRLVTQFAQNGGEILVYGSDKELASVPKSFPKVVRCGTVDEVVAYLRGDGSKGE